MIKTLPLLLLLFLCLSCLTATHAQGEPFPAPASVIVNSYKSIQQLPQPDWLIKEGDNPLTIQDLLNGEIKGGLILAIDPDKKGLSITHDIIKAHRGELGQRYELYYIVAGLWIFQLIMSPIWLRYFQYGPAEWIWRSLTYQKRQQFLVRPVELPIKPISTIE